MVVASEVELGIIEIVPGSLAILDIETSPYGGVNGTIRLTIGDFAWYPDVIWLVPEGFSPADFNYTGSTYRLPAELNAPNNCASSVYESDGKRAFKSSVKDGVFCILADPGTFTVVAEY